MRRLVIALLACSALAAEVAISPLFGDHAVLQAGDGIAVWGTAADGERVSVRFAGSAADTVAAEGRWLVRLAGLKPSAVGQDLVVQGGNTLTSHDVLIGDVWLASGQSNMERQLGLRNGQQPIENYQAEAAAADFPAIRFFTVAQTAAAAPTLTLKGAWQVVEPKSVLQCSAVGFFFARAVHQARKLPIGLVHSSWGGTPAQAWTSREALAAVPGLGSLLADQAKAVAGFPAALAAWKADEGPRQAKHAEAVAAAKAAGKPAPAAPKPPSDPATGSRSPTALYNGMISPLLPLAVRGVIWYQGESNAGNPVQYETLLSTLIADWRSRFAAPALPFLIVQIAPHKNMPPALREAQQHVADAVPHTGLVCLLDIGDANDIHPTRKRPVGERLALLARKQVYGEADVVASGPRFLGASFAEGKAVVRFGETAGGLVAQGGALSGFTVAGADGTFVEATAVIAGETVVVSAPGVAVPTAVRYGWVNAPVATLANGAGLPAFPFRSDEK